MRVLAVVVVVVVVVASLCACPAPGPDDKKPAPLGPLVWKQVATTTSPDARIGTAIAFDAATKSAVLFGGQQSGSGDSEDDTWTFDGPSWTKPSLATFPVARQEHAMAFDTKRGAVVVFGGCINDVCPPGGADTWQFEGGAWSELHPSTTPPGCVFCAMAYDSRRDVAVLFGGAGDGSNDTWEWDGHDWNRRTPSTSPPARVHGVMAYDAVHEHTVLFGGLSTTTAAALGDTWLWDGTDWSELTSTPAPPARSSHAMTFDAARGVSVLFGGIDATFATLADLWELDGATWKQVTPAIAPSARSGHAMTFDSVRGAVVLFGGQDANDTGLDDTWLGTPAS